MSWISFILFLYYMKYAMFLQVVPESPKVVYLNPKYLNYTKIFLRKPNRNTIAINADAQLLVPCGNNVSISLILMEKISGRYIPTAIQSKYRLCDWLNEPMLGVVWAKLLPKNFTCPIPKTRLIITNAVVDIPETLMEILDKAFTWGQGASVFTRMDVTFSVTATNERIIEFYTHFNLILKPHKVRKN